MWAHLFWFINKKHSFLNMFGIHIYLLAKKGIQLITHTSNSNTYHTRFYHIHLIFIFRISECRWSLPPTLSHPLLPTWRFTLTQKLGSIGYNIISPHPNCTQQPYRITVIWMLYATGVSTITWYQYNNATLLSWGRDQTLSTLF